MSDVVLPYICYISSYAFISIPMAIISDFFHVDIGYLTGETDAETFSLKKMSSFTGLSCEAIKAIPNITSPTSHFHFGYDSEILRKILSAFLQSDSFVGLIDAMHSLNDCELSVEQLKEKLSATFDEATIQRAFIAITGTDDYEHDTTLPPLPENVIAAYKMIKDIQDKEYGLSYSQKIARFELNEAFILLINELFGNDDKPIIYK